MKRLGIAIATALLGLATLSTAAMAAPYHHFHRGVYIGANPYIYGYGPYYPYMDWQLGYYPPPPNTGILDIDTSKYARNDSVYIDGGYAGVAKRLKDVPLNPGTHELEIRTSVNGQVVLQENVNIALGHKTTVDVGKVG